MTERTINGMTLSKIREYLNESFGMDYVESNLVIAIFGAIDALESAWSETDEAKTEKERAWVENERLAAADQKMLKEYQARAEGAEGLLRDALDRAEKAEAQAAEMRMLLAEGDPEAPYWIPKSLRKTVGGQLVGHGPLHCESFGGSDYCRHCGRDMCTATGKPNICSSLEQVRLGLIPDKEVLAFECAVETGCVDNHLDDVIRCEKWCHRAQCPFTVAGDH